MLQNENLNAGLAVIVEQLGKTTIESERNKSIHEQSSKYWLSQRDETEKRDQEIERIKAKFMETIFVAIGEASMLWSESPKGEFQSNKATEIGEKLYFDIFAETIEKPEKS